MVTYLCQKCGNKVFRLYKTDYVLKKKNSYKRGWLATKYIHCPNCDKVTIKEVDKNIRTAVINFKENGTMFKN